MTNVFLDTQVFIQKNFNFNQGLLRKLTNDAKEGLISIYMTEVVKKEIEMKIHTQVFEKVRNGYKNLERDLKILKNLSQFQPLFQIPHLIDEIYEELSKQFNEFINSANVKIISIDGVSPSLIFEKYFEGKAPFSGKKKDEFPDAFSLVAMENYFESCNEKINVISGDNDLKAYCENSKNLIYEPSLESFFNNLTKNESYMHNFVLSAYGNNIDKIGDCISENFIEHWFELIDEHGDVEKIEADSIMLEDEPYIIEINFNENDNEITANIALNANVEFTAEVSYLDYTNSYYDKEEGKYLFKNYIDSSIENVIEIPVNMEIVINSHDKDEISIQSLTLNEDKIIEICFPIDY